MEYLEELPSHNFLVDPALADRNQFLNQKGLHARFTKTGTTIVGCIFNDGVILAADTRATGGSTVLDKNCDKLHYLAPNIYCSGAGTAADTEHVTYNISYQLELLRLYSRRESRLITAMTKLSDHLTRYGGHIGAYLIVGGIDPTGPSLYSISADGNYKRFPYQTMGSGCLAAMTVFESFYKDGMDREEAINLCIRAIEAGIFNDLGSGSNVDVVAIDSNGVERMRNVRMYNHKASKGDIQFKFPRGVTPVLGSHDLVVQDIPVE